MASACQPTICDNIFIPKHLYIKTNFRCIICNMDQTYKVSCSNWAIWTCNGQSSLIFGDCYSFKYKDFTCPIKTTVDTRPVIAINSLITSAADTNTVTGRNITTTLKAVSSATKKHPVTGRNITTALKVVSSVTKIYPVTRRNITTALNTVSSTTNINPVTGRNITTSTIRSSSAIADGVASNTAALIGGVVGGVLAFLVIISILLIIFFCCRRKNYKSTKNTQDAEDTNSQGQMIDLFSNNNHTNSDNQPIDDANSSNYFHYCLATSIREPNADEGVESKHNIYYNEGIFPSATNTPMINDLTENGSEQSSCEKENKHDYENQNFIKIMSDSKGTVLAGYGEKNVNKKENENKITKDHFELNVYENQNNISTEYELEHSNLNSNEYQIDGNTEDTIIFENNIYDFKI